MRITGGRFRGRTLKHPRTRTVRPTSDKVREALFQILSNHLGQDWTVFSVLDLFAGSGSLGLEALSRGARHVTFIDSDQRSLDTIAVNLSAFGMSGQKARLVRARIDSRGFAKRLSSLGGPYRLIFADPPYSTGLSAKVLRLVADTGTLADGGIMAIEAFKSEGLPGGIERKGICLEVIDKRVYGQTMIRLYRGHRAQEGVQ